MSKKSQNPYSSDLPKGVLEEIERVKKAKKLTQSQVKKLVEAVKKEFSVASFEPGEAIGIVAAQSISEQATQMTMRTYHFAGSVGIQVTLGLPRLIEIFDARKTPKTPQMNLYLKRKFNKRNYSEKIAKKIKEKTVKDFITSVSIDLTNKMVKISLKKMRKKEMEDFVTKLRNKLKGSKITRRRRMLSIKYIKRELPISSLQKFKKKILDTYIAGIPRIKSTIVVKEGRDWVIKTLGSNLKKISSFEEIDARRSYSNDIHETRMVLGIEAARNVIIKEVNRTLQQQGLDVDDRHVTLAADMMTFSGEVNSIGRYGVAGMKPSVLTRAGFEETIKHIIRASIRREVDDFKGIFENVMVNQQVPVGTGIFDLVAKLGEK